jgi:TolB-like protein
LWGKVRLFLLFIIEAYVMKRMIAAIVCAVVCSAALAAQDTLAVFPFSGGADQDGEAVAELFSFSKELSETFTVIPRTSISRAINSEQQFQLGAGMTDPDTIAAIGQQLGAKYVVTGNIAKLGNRNLLIISILKIDDLRQVAGDIQTYGRIEEVQDKLPTMARNIINAIQLDSSQFEKLAVLPVTLGSSDIDERVADTLAQILSINLIRSGKYAVYPRTATLEQVQAEYSTQLSGAVADENIVDMGKADNPRIVLSVAARWLGTRKMFNASIISLESGAQLVGEFENYDSLDDGIAAIENLTRKLTGISTIGSGLSVPSQPAATPAPAAPTVAPVKRFSDGAMMGYGLLNLVPGLGSLIQGDGGGAGIILLTRLAPVGLILWEVALDYDDPLAGIPGFLGLASFGFSVVYGFMRPFVYNNNQQLAEIMDGVRLAVAPDERGGAAVRLSYSLKF